MGASPSHHVGGRRKCPYRRAETRLLAHACAAAALVLVATAIWPEIDLRTARLVILAPDSALLPFASILREAGRGAPLLLFVGLVAGLMASAVRDPGQKNTKIRRAIYVASVLALGPGLLVNAGLKNYSHRPRPLQTAEIASGASPFRPFYRIDGDCRTNCSFASGEAASAFWTAAPALLAPSAVRFAAVCAALGFGLAVAILRMMLGAHFLSDVAFSALAILLLTLGARRLLKIDRCSERPPEPAPDLSAASQFGLNRLYCPTSSGRKKRMLRGLYIASALGLALAGAAATLNYAFLRPTTLRVAVAQGTDDHKLVDAIGRVFSVSRDNVRFRVVPVGTATASSAALQSENVDLAVIRSDISVPPNGQTLVILHRNPALLIARGDDTIGSVPELKGKTVGIVRSTATGVGNATLFDTILAQYEIDPSLVRHEIIERKAIAEAVRTRHVDVLFVVGPATAEISTEAVSAVVKASGSAKFLPIAEAKAMAQRSSALDSTEVVRGAFGGDPPRPAETFETVGVTVRLMARATLKDSIAADVMRRLFSERLSIARLDKLANQIEAPPTDKGAAMPVHPGAAAYLDDEEKDFFDKYSDFIYLGAMALSVLGSGLAAVATRISTTRHNEFDRLLERLLEILKGARSSNRLDELDELEREADEILASSLANRRMKGLDSHAMAAFGLALDQARDAIKERRALMLKQPTRPAEMSRIALGE